MPNFFQLSRSVWRIFLFRRDVFCGERHPKSLTSVSPLLSLLYTLPTALLLPSKSSLSQPRGRLERLDPVGFQNVNRPRTHCNDLRRSSAAIYNRNVQFPA
jgi:hypothetical protein